MASHNIARACIGHRGPHYNVTASPLVQPTHVYIHIRTVKNPHTMTVIWRTMRTTVDR